MNDYRITIKTSVADETSELIAMGTVSDENGQKTIGYFDAEDNSRTRIVIGGGLVSIVKEGEVGSVLTFEKGKEHDADIIAGSYDIPFTVRTEDLNYETDGDSHFLHLWYTSDLTGDEKFEVVLRAEKIH